MGRLDFILALNRDPLARRCILVACIPLVLMIELVQLLWLVSRCLTSNPLILRLVFRTSTKKRLLATQRSSDTALTIDDTAFPALTELNKVLDMMESTGLRSTAGRNHDRFADYLEKELRGIDGSRVRKEAGELCGPEGAIPIAGAIPLWKPSIVTGPLIYLPRRTSLASVGKSVRGKVILRDITYATYPYALLGLLTYSKTSDMYADALNFDDRPASAEMPIDDDLINAGKLGAMGLIQVFDVPGSQVEGYFEPHQGIHFAVPGVFVGVDEGVYLKELAGNGGEVTLRVKADVGPAQTRNLLAVLPSQTSERVVFASHTDGNTLVQENGVTALLSLARYFASLPVGSRRRSIEFVFGTAHLQVSREGLGRHSLQIGDPAYDTDGGDPVLAIALEHMGTSEVEPLRRKSAPGRELVLSGRNEIMLWSVGPSPPLLDAVQSAVSRRELDRTIITRGTSLPDIAKVASVASFGGIGTFYHQRLFPTTALISGPWSLWAPSFGRSAVDVRKLRDQTMALGDVFFAVDGLSRGMLLGGYKGYRERLASGGRRQTWPSYPSEHPL